MDTVFENGLLTFLPDTVEEVRKDVGLYEPGRMDEALDILEEWLQKQTHFTRKDFSRGYLERILIFSKGSLERTKQRIDKLCTIRTLMPEFYSITDIRKEFGPYLNNKMAHAIMPKLTKDHYRVGICRFLDEFEAGDFINYVKFGIMMCEYSKFVEYSKGFIVIADYRNINVMHFVTRVNPSTFAQVVHILTEGYGMKLKGSYVISDSKAIEMVTSVFKKLLSPKLAERIHVVKDEEELHNYVPKEVLPEEYGGEQKSLKSLGEEWLDLLSLPENVTLYEEMKTFTVNEEFRQSDKCNDAYLGMPGTFRALSVD